MSQFFRASWQLLDSSASILVLLQTRHGFNLLTLCNIPCIWLESCSSPTNRTKAMFKSSAQKVLPKKRYSEEGGWDYLEEGTLKLSRSARVCMTCVHFHFSCDKHCHTLLTCRAHARLIPQGSHLTSRCPQWHKNYEDKFGIYPEAA